MAEPSEPAQSVKLSLRSLRNFGDVAAENDSVLEYFLQTSSVRELVNDKRLLVIGRKGAGKTAIVRYFTERKSELAAKALSLRAYPWNVHSLRIDLGASDIEAYVSSWRYILAVEIASSVIANCSYHHHDEKRTLEDFFTSNYGAVNPELADILKPKKLTIGKFSLQPAVLGNQLGSVDLERKKSDFNFGTELNALSDSLLHSAIRLHRERVKKEVYIHFDELDHGIEILDEKRRAMITGLILATRDVKRHLRQESVSIFPVIYLRTDIWDDLNFSDKNKITQGQSLLLEWDKDTLKELIEVRLRKRLGPDATWANVSDDQLMRGSQPKWNHIVNRSLRRPRDVIQFLNIALKAAQRRKDDIVIFSNKDITGAKIEYSTYLKKELDDEIRPHWSLWDQALQACSTISTEVFAKEDFMREYNLRRSAANALDGNDALRMLHRFSVVGYEKRSGYGGSGWSFQFEEPDAGWDNSATRFKVHPGLKEYAKLRETRAQATY